MDELKEFIQRCESLLGEQAKENHQKEISLRNEKQKEWVSSNRERQREMQKKYRKTEKGNFAKSKSSFKYRSGRDCQNIDWKEKTAIGEFYKNCPEGYEVDHIIPVSRGGEHTISNLQYLTHSENRIKHNMTMDEFQNVNLNKYLDWRAIIFPNGIFITTMNRKIRMGKCDPETKKILQIFN